LPTVYYQIISVFAPPTLHQNSTSQYFRYARNVRRHGTPNKNRCKQMKWFKDVYNRQIRLTYERQEHIETDHPEMFGQIDRVQDTLSNPDTIVRSRTDPDVDLFYRHYDITPVTEKYLCVVIKVLTGDLFIITAYFTDTIKRGRILWKRK